MVDLASQSGVNQVATELEFSLDMQSYSSCMVSSDKMYILDLKIIYMNEAWLKHVPITKSISMHGFYILAFAAQEIFLNDHICI